MNTTDYDIFFSDDDDEISMSINSNENTLQSQKRDGEVVILRNKVNQMEAEHFKTINKLSQRIQEMKREFEEISIAKEREIERLKIESSFMENEISSRILQSTPSSAVHTARLTQNLPNFDSDLLFRPKKFKNSQSEIQSKEGEQQQKQLQQQQPKDSIHTIINKTHHYYITKENISKEDKRTISECRDLIEKYLTPVGDYSVITTVLKIVYEGSYGRKIVLLPFILSLILNCLSPTTTITTTTSTTTTTTFLKGESLSIIENLLLGNQKSKNTFMTSIRIMIAVKGTSSLRDDFIVGGRIVECFLSYFFRNTFEDIFNLSELLKLAQITFQQNRQQFRKAKFVEQINQFLRTVIGSEKRVRAVESLLFEELIYKFWYLKIAPIGLLLEPVTLRLLVRSLHSPSVYYDNDNSKPQNHRHHKLLLPIFHEWICVEMAPIIPLLGREIFNLSRFITESLLEDPNSLVLQKLDKTITDSLVSL